MKNTKDNSKLVAWDLVTGKNPVGEMATVHIPMDKISWFAHSASERLDIGIDGSVIHLLQRDSDKNEATNGEIARSLFNKVGCAYWIEEDLGDLYEKLEAMFKDRLLNELIKEKVHDPKDWEAAKALLTLKPTKKKLTPPSKEQYERFNKLATKFINRRPDYPKAKSKIAI